MITLHHPPATKPFFGSLCVPLCFQNFLLILASTETALRFTTDHHVAKMFPHSPPVTLLPPLFLNSKHRGIPRLVLGLLWPPRCLADLPPCILLTLHLSSASSSWVSAGLKAGLHPALLLIPANGSTIPNLGVLGSSYTCPIPHLTHKAIIKIRYIPNLLHLLPCSPGHKPLPGPAG